MSKHSKYVILVVDDDECVCRSFAFLLTSAGYEVSTACDGLDALSKLQCGIPHLIICDLNMPKMSGFEFIPIVRCHFPEIPLIAVSSAHECCGSIAQDLQADAFYPKGEGQPGKLLNMVADMLACDERLIKKCAVG